MISACGTGFDFQAQALAPLAFPLPATSQVGFIQTAQQQKLHPPACRNFAGKQARRDDAAFRLKPADHQARR